MRIETGTIGSAPKGLETTVPSLPHAAKDLATVAEKARRRLSDAASSNRADHPMTTDQAVCVLSTAVPNAAKGRHHSVDKTSSTVSDAALIDELAELGIARKFWIKSVNRQKTALGALIRLSLGWTSDLPEAESKKIKERAARIIKGNPQTSEDKVVARRHANEIAIMGQTITMMETTRNNIELAMKKTVRKLPVYKWAKSVRGLGELGLAVIVAEAGDLSNYPKKGHLWKRLGLAPFQGRAYSTWRMKGGLSAEQWTEAGYSPRRRAEIYSVVSEPLFRCQSPVQGPYRELYDRRRALTATTNPDWTKAHSHMDGLRVMTKIMLRDLWREWKS